VTVAPLPAEWPVNRPLAWRMEVRGGYSAEALKNLLRLQLASIQPFSDYAASVVELNVDGSVPRYAVSLYAQFRERGEARLPDLVFPWYDPTIDRLQQLRLPGVRVVAFDPARLRLLAWLRGLSAIFAAFALGYWLWRMLGWRLRRYHALAGLERTTDTAGLVRQLCAFSLRPRTLPAATLGEWQQRMRAEASVHGLTELVEAVEAARYGNGEAELDKLLQKARHCLAAARPL
jgi:hypothetical protein